MQKRVAVIGCGAVGAITAIELLRLGHRVTLCDGDEPGGQQAASFGNAGFLSVQSVLPPAEPGVWKNVPKYVLDPLGPLAIRLSYIPKVAPWLVRYLLAGSTQEKVRRTAIALNALLRDAPALHESLASEAGCSELVERKGLLHTYINRAAYENEAFAWGLRRDLGIRYEELDERAMRECHSQVPERYRFGVFIPDAGRCRDPGAYVAALARHAKAQGAAILRGKVLSINRLREGLPTIETDTGNHEFDIVVIAAGIRSAALARSIGERVPLETERGYHVSVPDETTDYGTAYMAGDAKMVVNGMAGFVRAAGQVEFAGVDAPPNWKRAEILAARLADLYPGLDMTKAKFWLGHRPSMPDGLPCIGRSAVSAKVIYAFGHGHVGLVGSARTGRLVAQLVSGQSPEIELAPFSSSRFH